MVNAVLKSMPYGQPHGIAGLDGKGSLAATAIAPGQTGATLVARLDDVTRRAPGASDDAAHGYARGNLWNVPDVGMWICDDATAGQAVWSPVPTGILPMDAVPGVTWHGWGTTRLRAGYAGAILNASSLDGSKSADISALPGGAAIDTPALSALIGPVPPLTSDVSQPNGPQMWSAPVNTLYDQTPDATGYNLTVPSGANAPQISPLYADRGRLPIAFADASLNWTTDKLGNDSNSQPINMQHPRLANATFPADSASLSFYAVMRGPAVSGDSKTIATFQATYPIIVQAASGNNVPAAYGSAALTVGGDTPLDMTLPVTPSLFSVISDTSGSGTLTARDDDNASYAGDAVSPVTTAGVMIGGLDTSHFGLSAPVYAILVGPALSPAQDLQMREAITWTYGLTPQVRDRFLLGGASTGMGASGWMDWTAQNWALQHASLPMIGYNFSSGGATVSNCQHQDGSQDALTLFDKALKPLYAPYARTVMTLEAGTMTNQLQFCGTSTLFADWQAWQGKARALGSNVTIIGETLFPQVGDADEETNRAAINAQIVAASGSYDVLYDVGNNPIAGAFSTLSDRAMTSWLDEHSPYLQAIEGNLLKAAIDAGLGASAPASVK